MRWRWHIICQRTLHSPYGDPQSRHQHHPAGRAVADHLNAATVIEPLSGDAVSKRETISAAVCLETEESHPLGGSDTDCNSHGQSRSQTH